MSAALKNAASPGSGLQLGAPALPGPFSLKSKSEQAAAGGGVGSASNKAKALGSPGSGGVGGKKFKLKKIRMYVIRHGEYVDTVAKGMVGHLNPGLSDNGTQQAYDLAQCLCNEEEIKLVVCSPLRRAALT